MKRIVVAVLASMLAGSAGAQVGYPPAKSPYSDVDQRHEITPVFGFLSTKRDPAKVAPRGGLLTGVQYEWRASGAVHLGGDILFAQANRTVLDPAKAEPARHLGDVSTPLYLADAFLAVSLTGERTWHHIMPMVNGGLGLVTNVKGADVGGYKFGTRFAFPWGLGVRYIPQSGRLQLRADVRDWVYSIGYPQAYYDPTNTAIITPSTAQSRWTHNFAMTLGFSFIFAR